MKKALEASENGTMTVNFDAKSTVKLDGKSYNYYGKIIGKDPESYIILSAHYDSYFSGFQDDHAAIGLMMGVAKGLVDSGYQPEKTIIFNALAAEEWGVSNTRYDWSTGAYNQIFNIHPEWVGKAFANMNFELPAYEHTTQDEIRSVYELNNLFNGHLQKLYQAWMVFIKTVFPLFHHFVLGPMTSHSESQVFQHFVMISKIVISCATHYHSQFDNEDTYNADALKFHLNLYGLLSMHYDQTSGSTTRFHYTFGGNERRN